MGHVVMDNRHGLVVSTSYTQATGKAERSAAVAMMKKIKGKRKNHLTVGADKNYDTFGHVAEMRKMNITLHAAENTKRRGGSALDKRTTRHAGYKVSQRKRKLVEEIFGWMKTIGLMRKTRHKGVRRGGWMFTFTMAAFDLIRIRNIAAAAG